MRRRTSLAFRLLYTPACQQTKGLHAAGKMHISTGQSDGIELPILLACSMVRSNICALKI